MRNDSDCKFHQYSKLIWPAFNQRNYQKANTFVESEKQLLLQAYSSPIVLGCQQEPKIILAQKMLLPIKCHLILANPDKSEFDDWNKTALAPQKLGFKISCRRFIEDKEALEETDLAFVELECRNNNNPVKIQKQLIKAENEVQKLVMINPEILISQELMICWIMRLVFFE